MSAKIRVYATAKNRAALGIAAAFLRLFPAASLAELNAAFKKDEITTLGYVSAIFVDVKDAEKIVNSIGQNRFASYYMTDEFIALADGSEVAALKTWSVETFGKLAARAAEFGIEVGEFQSAAHFQRGHFRLEILDPALADECDGLTPDAAAPLDDELAKIQRASLDAVFSNAVEALGDGAGGENSGADFGGAGAGAADANSNLTGGAGEKPSVSQQDFQDILNLVVSGRSKIIASQPQTDNSAQPAPQTPPNSNLASAEMANLNLAQPAQNKIQPQPQSEKIAPEITAQPAQSQTAQDISNSNLAQSQSENLTPQTPQPTQENAAQTFEPAQENAAQPQPQPAPQSAQPAQSAQDILNANLAQLAQEFAQESAPTPERKPTRAELKEARAASKKAAKYDAPHYELFANEARDRVFGLVCAVVLIAAVAAFFVFVKPML